MLRIFLILFLVIGVTWSSSATAQIVINLQDAQRLALERNLNLQAEAYNTRASEALVRRGFGIYDPRFQTVLAEGEGRTRLNILGLEEISDIRSETRFRRFDFSLSQRLPTGADLILGFENRREERDPPPAIDPTYTPNLSLSLVQPLLRDFGRTVTEQGILFAVKDREISVQTLREQAFLILAGVRNAYFDVLRFRDNLAYRETSVELARRVLEENRARVRAGVLPPVETLEAEVGLKLRERELLDAQRAYQEAIDALALLLNMTGEIAVADEPLTQPDLHADEAEGFRSAMVRRPDLQGRLREIERLQIERTVARNRTLPVLDLSARYGHGGLRDSYSDALDELASRGLRSWEVGVLFSYPIGNREARNDLLVSDLRLKGRRALLSQLEDDIRQEIRSAIRLLEVNRAMIEVTELGTALAQERLDSLLKRRDVGLATTRDVLEGEEDLAQARTLHIAALADYNGGITEYLRATGILLESQGIYFAGDLDPRAEQPLLRIAE